MKRILFILALLCLEKTLHAQYVYTIKADSVKITNSCDTAELIIENHTQTVPGFLFNKGRGRTEFRMPSLRVGDNVYEIKGETTTLPNVWVQSGNSFGAIGILGTKDNNHLDLYTNNNFRARMTNGGNFLIGKTVDNGCRLQVDGCSEFSGNVNIGTATITNTGNLINTNAVLFNHFISQYRSYMGNDPYISKLDNVLYNYNTRFKVVNSVGDDGSKIIRITIPEDEFAWENSGIVYPGGNMYFSFWNNGVPGEVSVKMWSVIGGAPVAAYSSNVNKATNGSGFFHIPIVTGFNYLKELETGKDHSKTKRSVQRVKTGNG